MALVSETMAADESSTETQVREPEMAADGEMNGLCKKTDSMSQPRPSENTHDSTDAIPLEHSNTINWITENGISESAADTEKLVALKESDPTQTSVTASNVFFLSKHSASEHAPTTTCTSPASLAGHTAKSLPGGPSKARTSGVFATPAATSLALSMLPITFGEENCDLNDTLPDTAASSLEQKVHRARKTMPRSSPSPHASNDSKEANDQREIQEESNCKVLESVKPQPRPFLQAFQQALPHNQKCAAATKKTHSAVVYRKKKRRMGTYSLVPKKKTKVLKQRTVIEMFKNINHSSTSDKVIEKPCQIEKDPFNTCPNLNGENVDMESEDEESEELEGEDDRGLELPTALPTENSRPSTEDTSGVEPTKKIGDMDSEEEPGETGEEEDDGDESDLSSESRLQKKLQKKKSKAR